MDKKLLVLGAAVGAVSLTACSSSGDSALSGPDEFRVIRKAPLTMPPDYNLRPPNPGEARPQELNTTDQARAALFGQTYATSATEGEQYLVQKAGGGALDPAIRAQVDFEANKVVNKSSSFADEVMSDSVELSEQQQQSVDNATGGGEVVIPRKPTRSKLPGL